MGKKSSDVPAPDPRLVEAQMRSMGVQDDAMKQVMALAVKQQAQNDELMPLQRQQMESSIAAAKLGQEQAQSDRTWMLGRRDMLGGLQDKMVADAATFNTPAEEARRAGAAEANIGKTYSDIAAARGRQMATMGVTPDSGRWSARDDADRARVTVGAANDERLAARNEGRALTAQATNALAGYPSMASGATGQGAQLAAGGLSLANQGAGGINAGYGAMTGTLQSGSGIAGQMGAGATNMWQAQGNYKLAADQANATDFAGIGSILGGGAAAGLAAKTIFSSSIEYKQDIERLGTHSSGAGIYRFRYKPEFAAKYLGGDKSMHVGVMAEEVRDLVPGSVLTDERGLTVVDYSKLGDGPWA